jgi:Icc-related predicted phosphoesterase
MSKLKIDLISDTHNQHKKFECDGGDIIVHTGDCSLGGKSHEICHFLDWYGKLDYKYKIFVPGNHDWAFERESGLMQEECRKRSIILLNDSGIELLGIKFWGSPVQPWFHSWAFNRDRGEDIKRHWDMIPDDTEVLLTHGPPHGFGDVVSNVDGTPKERVGCYDLLEKIQKSQVKLHVCGHIHESRGIIYDKIVTYVNASCLDRMYYPASKRPIRATREVVQDGSIVYLAEE